MIMKFETVNDMKTKHIFWHFNAWFSFLEWWNDYNYVKFHELCLYKWYTAGHWDYISLFWNKRTMYISRVWCIYCKSHLHFTRLLCIPAICLIHVFVKTCVTYFHMYGMDHFINKFNLCCSFFQHILFSAIPYMYCSQKLTTLIIFNYTCDYYTFIKISPIHEMSSYSLKYIFTQICVFFYR